MKVGHYEPREVKKGFNETTLPVKEGGIYWVIQLDKYSQMDVRHQETAEIMSQLIKINNLLKRRSKPQIVNFHKRKK